MTPNPPPAPPPAPNLRGVHRAGGEGGVGQRLCGAEQAVGRGAVAPVGLDGFQAQPLAGQQRLGAGRITGGGQELEIAVATPQQEAQPVGPGGGAQWGGTWRPARAAPRPQAHGDHTASLWRPYSIPMVTPQHPNDDPIASLW